ncbi:nucleolus and neural progenitor protein [Salminus brasiliensis]|uniref:nucleolus and neural progenitor protein n=1 Tax=Salminus brasiliensis TaxID=930266 RepID=UPI003B82F5C8
MAVDLWNKVDIPRPSAASTCRIAFSAATEEMVESFISHGSDVLRLLGSDVLHTEIRVLYEVLYVVNNSQRQHRPFRAIKQVEQCINRLNEMKLLGALQDLQELCPNKIQRDVGLDVGHCDVPSQPVLEWFCLKLLGASGLLARTLDQCTKAFSLTRQHLRLAEFILLNLVLLSMLSRLWVFFRGILRALVPMYQSTVELRQQVAQCWPMAYLTNFALPEDLESFLSPSHCDLLKTENEAGAPGSSALDKLFKEGEKVQVEDGEGDESKLMQMLAREGVGKSSVDLGKAVLREGPHYSGSSSVLDIRSVLQRTHGVSSSSSQCAAKLSPVEPDPAFVQQKETYLKLLRTVSSFSELDVQLKEMTDWCRKCKLRQERRHLAFLLLQCQRMKTAEGEGVRVQKRLRRLRMMVRRVLRNGTGAAQPPSSPPSFQWRTHGCIRNRFITLMARYGSVRNRVRLSRTPSRIARDLFGVAAKTKSGKNLKNLPEESLVKDTKVNSEVRHSQKENSEAAEKTSQEPSCVKKSEIDDIFAKIGF